MKFTATPQAAAGQTVNDLAYPDQRHVWHVSHMAHAIEMYFDGQADAWRTPATGAITLLIR
jgi:hypothetical protein